MNHYYNPVRTVVGRGSIGKVEEIVEQTVLSGEDILFLVWDESVWEKQGFQELLSEKHFRIHRICFQESNPTVEQLFELFKRTEKYDIRLVVAVGGGSVMDVGKSLCCLYGKKIETSDQLRQMIQAQEYGIPKTKWIGVPTTAGTGSEVTCWATIWDPENNRKQSVESKENYALAAVVDPDLAMGMPIGLAVSSALDAVAHAVESYWAKGSNLVSQGLALHAIRKIMAHIDGLALGEEEAHLAMAEGSMLAGMAFSNTKTTACHSISYPLTMRYKIPHGVAVSMLLAPVMEMNLPFTQQAGILLEALGVENVEELRKRIRGIFKKAGIPDTLKSWNVKAEELENLASLGITKGRADNNPADLDQEKIRQLLTVIYE